MKLIKDTEFLIIDFETITPKGRSPEPIEVGILKIKENNIDKELSFDWLIRPPKDLHLTYFDTIQTGIREKDLEFGKDVNSVMKDIDNLCSNNNYVFIAQNAKYESNILSHYTEKFRGIAKTPIIDTILIAKKVLPNLENYKLDTLARTFDIPIPRDRHRALSDCYLTAKIFLKLIKLQQDKFKIKYLEDLFNIAKINTKYNDEFKQITLEEYFDL